MQYSVRVTKRDGKMMEADVLSMNGREIPSEANYPTMKFELTDESDPVKVGDELTMDVQIDMAAKVIELPDAPESQAAVAMEG